MTFNVPKGVDVRAVVARGMLTNLGLVTDTDIAAFSIFRNLMQNFYQFTLDDFRARHLFDDEIAAAKNKPFISVVIYVPYALREDVNLYLDRAGRPIRQADQGLVERISDAERQVATGIREWLLEWAKMRLIRNADF